MTLNIYIPYQNICRNIWFVIKSDINGAACILKPHATCGIAMYPCCDFDACCMDIGDIMDVYLDLDSHDHIPKLYFVMQGVNYGDRYKEKT